MTTVLETTRLRLRPMSPADRPFLAAMLGDPEVMQYYPRSTIDAGPDPWIDRQVRRYMRDGHGLWLVEDRGSGEPYGQVGICIQDVNGVLEPELGYMVHRPHWRRGIASEAGDGCLDWAFRKLRPPRIVSLIVAENARSQGVARKLGMRRAEECMHAGMPHFVFEIHAGDAR